MPIYQKIQKVMQAVKGVEKDSTNTHARYKYAGHEAVTEALRGHFAELGIVRQVSVTSCNLLDGGTVQIMVRVTYTDVEDDTHIDLDMPAIQPSQTKAGSVTAQQIGQAVSYAVKNIEFKLFSLTGDTEPDADSMPINDGQSDNRDWRPKQPNHHAANGTAQAVAQQQADIVEDVLVRYNDEEAEGAATATEGGKLLAGRMKRANRFEASKMMGMNLDWIQSLPRPWQDRLEDIVNQKRAADAKREGGGMGAGRAA